ncbi:hypothetical protein SCALIN_C45_0114 [Candidatus Scalindua japonica]|uniref:Uncharacterized protein n=1 Tax=Candidatus Scalindua japonica TaxID=1284222 RepID=A0A286U4A7_9BACT|nr:hypothetical protein SCALIN_C45_0114 [Candidatus Scalindua japonica]
MSEYNVPKGVSNNPIEIPNRINISIAIGANNSPHVTATLKYTNIPTRITDLIRKLNKTS